MTGIPQDALRWFRRARSEGRILALLFDYDGTLTPVVERPGLAVLAPQMREVLASLAARPEVRLGVISGRGLTDLKRMVALDGIDYVGTAGLEMELGGERITHPDAEQAQSLLDALAIDLRGTLAAYPGAWLEIKPLGVTVHYRQVAEILLGPLQEILGPLLRSQTDRFHVLPGPMAVEIVPELGWTKGTAVEAILKRLDRPFAACFAGDHANDASAFETVDRCGGISIGVGPEAPVCAKFRLDSPQTLFDLLVEVVVQLESRSARRDRSVAMQNGRN